MRCFERSFESTAAAPCPRCSADCGDARSDAGDGADGLAPEPEVLAGHVGRDGPARHEHVAEVERPQLRGHLDLVSVRLWA